MSHSMSADLVMLPSREAFMMPVLTIKQAVERRKAIVDFTQQVMILGTDYGVIPGTQEPTLFKPGAEKLCTLFGLTSRFIIVTAVEDWTGADHEGEPFFYFVYRCQLSRDGHHIAEGDGSCNSWESKYRYRNAQRKCPACNQATIIKGKAEYGGGWVCHKTRGGCGAKYPEGDTRIEGQQLGRVANMDVADQVNTLQKMAQKRALIGATLLAVNASEFFTQDLEDRATPEKADGKVESEKATTTQRGNRRTSNQPAVTPPAAPQPSTTSPPAETPQAEQKERSYRAQFTDKARNGYRFDGVIGDLAIEMLGYRPDEWNTETWMTAFSRPESEWEDAISRLSAPPPANPPAETTPEPTAVPVDPDANPFADPFADEG
jgi:hypothetical protein